MAAAKVLITSANSRRRGLRACASLAVLAFTAVGAAIPAVSANAYGPAALPSAAICAGSGSQDPSAPTHFDAELTCGLTHVQFHGTAATPGVPNFCLTGTPQLIEYEGTEQTDGGTPSAATWTLVGSNDQFAIRTQSTAATRVGYGSGVGCVPGFGSGVPIRLAELRNGGPPQDPFVCEAAGSVGPITKTPGAARTGQVVTKSFGDPYVYFNGPTRGTGTCVSAFGGKWSLSYNGTWEWPRLIGTTTCNPAVFSLMLTLTAPGQTLTIPTRWYEGTNPSANPQGTPVPVEQLVTVQPDEFHPENGAGLALEQPDHCSYPHASTLKTTTVWSFVNNPPGLIV